MNASVFDDLWQGLPIFKQGQGPRAGAEELRRWVHLRVVSLGCTDCQKRDCQHLCDCKKVDSFYGAVATVIKLMLLSLIYTKKT